MANQRYSAEQVAEVVTYDRENQTIVCSWGTLYPVVGLTGALKYSYEYG